MIFFFSMKCCHYDTKLSQLVSMNVSSLESFQFRSPLTFSCSAAANWKALWLFGQVCSTDTTHEREIWDVETDQQLWEASEHTTQFFRSQRQQQTLEHI